MQIFLRFRFQERLWSSYWTCLPALQSVQQSDNPRICIFWRSLVTARTCAVRHWPKAFPWQLCAKGTAPQTKNAPWLFFFLLNNWNNTLTATGAASPLIWSYWHWISPGRWKDWRLWFCGPQPELCFAAATVTAPGQRAGWGFWLKPPAVMWPVRADIWGQCSEQCIFKLQLQQCRWWKSTEHYTQPRGRGASAPKTPPCSLSAEPETRI